MASAPTGMTPAERILAAKIRRLEAALRTLKRIVLQATAEQDSGLDLEPDFAWLFDETPAEGTSERAKLVLRPQQQVDAAVPHKRRRGEAV